MLKGLVTGLMLVALTASAHAQQPHSRARPVQAVPDGGISGAYWNGGPHTLPYGAANGGVVLDHLHAMEFMQPAIDEMQRQGYIRRQDLDLATTHEGYSSAILAFEKQGRPVDREEAIILVVTKPFWIVDFGWIPVTQVTGGIVCDSAGVVFTKTSAVDSALALVGTVSTLSIAPGLEPMVNSDDLEFRYSCHENRPWSGFENHMSPGMQCLWKQWGQRMGVAAGAGMVSGLAGEFASGRFGWQTLAAKATVGAAVGMWTANENFWLSPPDTSNCP